jgi:hypothetical protein
LWGTPLYNTRCPVLTNRFDSNFEQNIEFSYVVSVRLQAFFFYSAHWLFAFRYFEVAEMLGRADKSNEAHLRSRIITSGISVGVILMYGFNFLLAIYNEYWWSETDWGHS